jgi:hypothetical protein
MHLKLFGALTRRYMNEQGEDGGDAGGGTTGPSAALLDEHGLSREEFDALSEGDKAALLADTSASDDLDKLEELAGDGTQDPPAATTAPKDTPAATAAPKDTPVATAAPAASPAPTAAPVMEAPAALPDVADDLKPPPVFVTKERRAEYDTAKSERATLQDKFNDGDLTAEEFKAQVAPLEAKIDEISGDIAAQRAANAMYQQAAEARWEATIANAFKAAKEGGGIDFLHKDNEALLGDLDATVKRLGQAAVHLYPNAKPAQRDAWALQEAIKDVERRAGVTRNPAAAAKQQQQQRQHADLSQIPPTLRGAPPAGDPNISGGEFDHIDKLATPAEKEKAVAALSPDALERYLDR